MVASNALRFVPEIDLPRPTLTMYQLPESDKGIIYQIRNIKVDYEDLLRLAQQGNMISGPVINAFGAHLQDSQESEKALDYCIFSSLLPPLVDREMIEGPCVGTVEEHINIAVSNFFAFGKTFSLFRSARRGRAPVDGIVGSFPCVVENPPIGY